MRPDIDEDWRSWRELWSLRPGTTYLNHGSFGPPPTPVREARAAWQAELDAQPMDFFVRLLGPRLDATRDRLARFVGADTEGLVLVENATYAMNIVAQSLPLGPGDEVLLNNHEYGAVRRIWERACHRAGAVLRSVDLPEPLESVDHVVDSLVGACGPRTRLLVVSHVTSPTAIRLPVEELCDAARRRGVAVCVDGPHAPAQFPVDLARIGCDFYTASCHKWLSAPFGSGFLYVAPPWRERIETPVLSWGRLEPERPRTWSDEFHWTGTRDPSAFLGIVPAIELLERCGLDAFRARTHGLARRSAELLAPLAGGPPLAGPEWYGTMSHTRLPDGDAATLQRALWERHGIEVPIVAFGGRRWIRVSCHLYTTGDDLERLVGAVRELLAERA